MNSTVLNSSATIPVEPKTGAQYIIDGRTYEIINTANQLISLRDIMGKRTLFYTLEDFKVSTYKKEVTLYQLAPMQESNAALFLLGDTPKVKAAQRKLFYVQRLAKMLLGHLPHKQTVAAIALLSKEIEDPKPPQYSTVYNWTKRFNDNGRLPFSLMKSRSYKSRGRMLPTEVSQIINRYIEEEYNTDQQNPVVFVYRLIKGQIANDNIHRRETNMKLLPTPSLRTVYRTIAKACAFRTDRKRIGEHATQKKHKFGGKFEEPTFLLEQAEMDCTPIDLMLVNCDGEYLGRVATLQVIIEVKSSKIIGYDLSLTPPSVEKTLKTLKSALQAVPGEELQRGLMEELTVDNGAENTAGTVKVIADTLGIHLRFVPPRKPDAKPHVERFFRTLNTQFIHTLPGTTFSNPQVRGDYDCEAHACITIEKLNDYFKDWLENFYHCNVHSTLGMSPNQKWDKCIERQLPPRKLSAKDLAHLLRVVVKRTITSGRVEIAGLSWTGPGLAEMEQRLKPKEQVLIFYDPSNLGEVFVCLQDRDDQVFRATATWPKYQNSLSMSEHVRVSKEKSNNALETEEKACQALLLLRQRIADEMEDLYKSRKHSTKANKQALIKSTSTITEQESPIVMKPSLLDDFDSNFKYETYYTKLNPPQDLK